VEIGKMFTHGEYNTLPGETQNCFGGILKLNNVFTKGDLLSAKKLYGKQESWSMPAALYHGVAIEPNSYYIKDSSTTTAPQKVNQTQYNSFRSPEVVAGYIKNCVLRDTVSCAFYTSDETNVMILADNINAYETLEYILEEDATGVFKREIERSMSAVERITKLLDEVFEVSETKTQIELLNSAISTYNFAFQKLNGCSFNIELMCGIREFAKHIENNPASKIIKPEYMDDLRETAKKSEFDNVDRLIVATFMTDMTK
jgi:hypothetical protein